MAGSGAYYGHGVSDFCCRLGCGAVAVWEDVPQVGGCRHLAAHRTGGGVFLFYVLTLFNGMYIHILT